MARAWLDTLERYLREGEPFDALDLLQRKGQTRTSLGAADDERLISAARTLGADPRLRHRYRLEALRIANAVERRRAESAAEKRRLEKEKAARRATQEKEKAARRAEELRTQRAAEKHTERFAAYRAAGLTTQRATILTLMKPGPYSVSITGMARGYKEEHVAAELVRSLGFATSESVLLVERAVHIAPESVAFDIDQSKAVQLKKALERHGAKIRIDIASRREAAERRPSIPQAVRHEVWRRDGGRCVDCGSVENLHFDHIIPWSRGGANTPRNLELRCEACNLRKGARI